MKYLIILAFFVGASFACRTYRQSCSHEPIDNEECCGGWECRVPTEEEKRDGDGNNTRCMNITSTTTTTTTTETTTTERSCRTHYQSCSDADTVSEDSCCSNYICRLPRRGERGDGQGNTRCFLPSEGGNEEETTTTTTEATTTEAACLQRNSQCNATYDQCCYGEGSQEMEFLVCREIIDGSGVFTCQEEEEETSTTEAPTTEEQCRVERDSCNPEADNCCDDLECEVIIEGVLAECRAPETTTTQAPCRRQNEECSILANNECCSGLECRANGTSVTGTCQAPTQSTTTSTTTTTTTTTRAPAQCRRRDQRCSTRRESEYQCCTSEEGDNEDLVCKRKNGERRSKCHLRSEPECQTRGQECRREADCCQYRDEERKICYRGRGRSGTCEVCRQREETCRQDSDCCNNVEGEEVTCVRERRRGEGKCQVESTTTTQRTTTSERTRRTTTRRQTESTTQRTRRTTQRSTTQRSTTQRSSTTEAPACRSENQQCQNTTECCENLVCQGILGLGPLAPNTCQRPTSTTTEESSSTTEEGSSSTLLPTGCSQRGGPCPNKTDAECCEDLKCVSIDGNTWQCGHRGVNGTAIV